MEERGDSRRGEPRWEPGVAHTQILRAIHLSAPRGSHTETGRSVSRGQRTWFGSGRGSGRPPGSCGCLGPTSWAGRASSSARSGARTTPGRLCTSSSRTCPAYPACCFCCPQPPAGPSGGQFVTLACAEKSCSGAPRWIARKAYPPVTGGLSASTTWMTSPSTCWALCRRLAAAAM